MLARPLLAVLLLAACGGDTANTDAGADAPGADARSLPFVGPQIELPLLESDDPSVPFNHSAEVNIDASGNDVVVAAINMHFAGAETFDTTGFHKRVGIAVSHDRGDSFGPAAIDPGLGDQTTDPNLRAAGDGSFWIAVWDTNNSTQSAVAFSRDGGESWTPARTDLTFGDKNWMAIDDGSQAVFVGAVSGLWKFNFAGDLVGEHIGDGLTMAGAYADAAGAHFIGGGNVVLWDGTGAAPVADGPGVPTGADLYQSASTPIGPTADGGQWILRATGPTTASAMQLRVRRLPDAGSDIAISEPGEVAFLPAADVDASGRIHLAYYATDGDSGALKYTHSVSADFADGFIAPLTIDGEACPGDFFPTFDSATGGRRLREYIDLRVAGNRAHIAWAHAPGPPSRVYASYVEFE